MKTSLWRRFLLRLFPVEFRDEYERELIEGWRYRAAQDGGRFWLRALQDTASTAPAEHFSILRQDLRYALRSIRLAPFFALSVIVIMAAGIGANTAIFSLVRAGLSRSVPYPQPERLVVISAVVKGKESDFRWVPPSDFEILRRGLHSFDSIAAMGGPGLTVRMNGLPERHLGARLAGDLFAPLGARAAVGRLPGPEDESPGAPPVVILDYGIWRDRFGMKSGVIGQPLLIDGIAHTIIGVLDSRFRFPLTFHFWIPLPRNASWWRERALSSDYTLFLVGRLARGATPASAEAELESRIAGLQQAFPETHAGRGFRVRPMREMIVGGFRPALIAFQCAVGLLLLIVCANVANLLAARASARRGELAIRAALGASPRRLVRQSITEALVLSSGGGAAGFILAFWLVQLLADYVPAGLQFDNWLVSPQDVRLDFVALTICAAVTILAGLLFGAAPAARAGRAEAGELIKQSGRALTSRSAARRWLVAAQTALATALLIGAVLLAQTVSRLQAQSLGFQTAGLMRARIASNPDRARSGEQARRFVEEVLDRSRRLNGASAVAMASWLPLGGPRNRVFYRGGASAGSAPGARPDAYLRVVTPGYFAAIGTTVLRGRAIEARDHDGAQRAVVISESVAKRDWPDRDPLGQNIELDWAAAKVPTLIVGIAADVRAFGPADPITPTVYVSSLQPPWDRVELREIAIRMLPGAQSPGPPLRRALATLDPDMPVYLVGPIDQAIENSIAQPVFSSDLLRLFAIAAVLLAVVGVYAAVSYEVAQQSRELALRQALGATPVTIIRQVLSTSLKIASLGVIAGILLAAALAQLLTGAVRGMEAINVTSVVLSTAALLTTSLAASLAPALRGSRIDPITALRA